MIGTCLWFDVKKGFGFIRCEDRDYFAHYSKVVASPGEFRVLSEGDMVEFDPIDVDRGGTKKLQAKNIKVVETTDNAVL